MGLLCCSLRCVILVGWHSTKLCQVETTADAAGVSGVFATLRDWRHGWVAEDSSDRLGSHSVRRGLQHLLQITLLFLELVQRLVEVLNRRDGPALA